MKIYVRFSIDVLGFLVVKLTLENCLCCFDIHEFSETVRLKDLFTDCEFEKFC